MAIINLQSNEGVVFEVEEKAAKMSTTIKTLLEDLCIEDDEDVIPLPNVSTAILKKVVEWVHHHQDDPPLPEENSSQVRATDNISPWDTEFLKVDQGFLFELMLAANYLDIKGLLDVACKCVANMIKGKTPEELRKTFNVKTESCQDGEQKI